MFKSEMTTLGVATSNIIQRFSLELKKLVQDEQDANFITRLHHGKLAIIPWPTIGSKQFYTLFPTLWKHLDQLEVTHKTAGEFLQTLKTLMAKLKVSFLSFQSHPINSYLI